MRTLRTPPLSLSLSLALLTASLSALSIAACDRGAGDTFAPYTPNALGTGNRIADISNPASPKYAANGATVNISGASVLWLDTFDETQDGKSIGTLYIEDVAPATVPADAGGANVPPYPFSGTSLYKQALVPANHVATPGDVFNLRGIFTQSTTMGSTVTFNGGTYLVQIDTPTCEFEYEYAVPPPKVINVEDLYKFGTGLQWTGMLVTLQNVTVPLGGLLGTSNRVTYPVSTLPDAPAISNELYNLQASDYPVGTTFSSVTGIVTWFFSFQIAPRTAADLVVATP